MAAKPITPISPPPFNPFLPPGKEVRLPVCIGGTKGLDDEWKNHDGPFYEHLHNHSLQEARLPFMYAMPRSTFYWCGQVDGLTGDNECWIGAAHNLEAHIYRCIAENALPETVVVDFFCHSHGGNVFLEGIRRGILAREYIGNVFFFSTPLRPDLKETRTGLNYLKNGKAFYIHGGWKDRWEPRGRISLKRLWNSPWGVAWDLLASTKTMREIPDSQNIIDNSKGHSDTLNAEFMLEKVWPRFLEHQKK